MNDYTPTPNYDEFLAHYGTKGMKWGKRKKKKTTYKYIPKFSEYVDGDPDFDDSNYDEKNRLGDTEFFGFVNKDGNLVILEEDMKWVIPGGTITPELVKKLESFQGAPSEKWRETVTNLITEGVNEKSKTKSTTKTAAKTVTSSSKSTKQKTEKASKATSAPVKEVSKKEVIRKRTIDPEKLSKEEERINKINNSGINVSDILEKIRIKNRKRRM